MYTRRTISVHYIPFPSRTFGSPYCSIPLFLLDSSSFAVFGRRNSKPAGSAMPLASRALFVCYSLSLLKARHASAAKTAPSRPRLAEVTHAARYRARATCPVCVASVREVCHKSNSPLGLTDKAWDLCSEDCGFESRRGAHTCYRRGGCLTHNSRAEQTMSLSSSPDPPIIEYSHK